MASPTTVDRAAVSLTNRCGESKSPYVRSHQHNPTAWQLWTPETLELARTTNRLLFVSIGYSACHWCHVMARECFDDARVAHLLNDHFVPVKVDREERPDLDRQYMDFVQATHGGGGWPLNVFATPELEPVFGGTYWPGASFAAIVAQVAATWQQHEARVRESGRQIARQLRAFAPEGSIGGRHNGRTDDHDELELDLLDDALQHYKLRYDPAHHGFGAAPKFPTPAHIRPLLRIAADPRVVRDIVGERECGEARAMAVNTLAAMARGGIKDQVGHGFARYSVTRDWSLPHFEKMLSDNAQLLAVYLDAYLLTRSPLFRDTVVDVATYLTSPPLQSSLGGFCSAEAADSFPTATDTVTREGAYYVWTMDEFQHVLSDDEVAVCARYWNVRPEGNIDPRHDAHGELAGRNTLCVQGDVSDLARELGRSEDAVRRVIEDGRAKLRAHREEHRPRPALDDKIVTAWNGLAIGGLARTSAALHARAAATASRFLASAVRAAECIQHHLFQPATGRLKRVYREGPGETPGFADDYAFFISGLLDLYEATFDSRWLQLADTLQTTQNALFWDEEKYGFFSTPAGQPDILARTKDAMDHAEPSVNGVSAANLFRLGSLLHHAAYEQRARRVLACFEVEIEQHPGLFSGMLSSVVASKLGMKRLVIVGDDAAAAAALHRARESLRPHCTLVRVGGGADSDWLRERHALPGDLPPGPDAAPLG